MRKASGEYKFLSIHILLRHDENESEILSIFVLYFFKKSELNGKLILVVAIRYYFQYSVDVFVLLMLFFVWWCNDVMMFFLKKSGLIIRCIFTRERYYYTRDEYWKCSMIYEKNQSMNKIKIYKIYINTH